MKAVNIAQPDVTLLLDMDGVIREVTPANAMSGMGVEAWVGRPLVETAVDVASDKVRRMVEDARTSGLSAFRQITQRFPGGLEIPMEYTTLLLGGKAGMLAIGKNLLAVAELQSRLIAAQQAMERDYWKLREVETRYRLLFEASEEAILLIRAANMRIVEANPMAIHALGLSPQAAEGVAGRELLPELAREERESFQAMLHRAREYGKAPGILLHLGRDRKPWMARASLMTSEPGPIFMLQLAPVGLTPQPNPRNDAVSVEGMIERVPDGFVVVDQDGIIRHANQAFLNLVEVGAKVTVMGENLGRWLWQPGADLAALLANVQAHGVLKQFSTSIRGELGTSTDIEISAVGDSDTEALYVSILMRDVSRRLQPVKDENPVLSALLSMADQVGKSSLRKLVGDTVEVVERHYIKAALDLAGGNRTAAAEILGLSRQSLYTKLNRYGADEGPEGGPERSE
ncbi:MAG: transcriptional regulator PpsR [Xanthobacteraceae bacterium]